jgi:hypothetical protein
MQIIEGTTLRVGSRTVRVDSATTLCSGVGSALHRDDVRRWSEFDCTFTSFSHGIDRDLEFRVLVVGRRTYRLTRAHWVSTER